MKFIDEYRQSDIAKRLAEKIAEMTDKPLKLMEVCGGHTHTYSNTVSRIFCRPISR